MKKGFTLIELLIVIAIIGILAGVILVSTNSARSKAVIAAARSVGKSTMPYVAECIASGGTVLAATNGGNVCNPDMLTDFPNLGVSQPTSSCSYSNTLTTFSINCSGTGNATCNYSSGACN